jgi:thymidylate synthase
MNNIDKQYQALLQDILDNGIAKSDRTGTGTLSVFGRQIRHKMNEGFPLLTTKKMAWKTMVTELLWFLRGDTNIKYLVDNGCHIWDGDAYKNYSKLLTRDFHGPHYTQEQFIELIKSNDKFAKDFGELGPIYGKQWRSWHFNAKFDMNGKYHEEKGIDQIQNLINDLKTNPDSRRLIVNAWNVGELAQMILPPCHYGFQLYTRELSLNERGEVFKKTYPDKSASDFSPGGMEVQSLGHQLTTRYNNAKIPTRAISLMWNQRSVDTFLGLPFNIASYGLLLEIIAKEVNMVPDELIGNLGDVHLYSNHIEQAKEQIGRFYTHEERVGLLKQSMGEENYNKAVSELVPFGGGMSEYYDLYKIPYKTRQSYLLPTLKFSDWYNNANEEKHSESVFNDWVESLKVDDFSLENYQSHSAIKAPLSN